MFNLEFALRLKSPLPMTISASLEYVGLDSLVGSDRFATYSLQNTKFSPDGSFYTNVLVEFSNDELVKRRMFDALNCVFYPHCTDSLIEFSNARFGPNKEESLALFAKASYPVTYKIDLEALRKFSRLKLPNVTAADVEKFMDIAGDLFVVPTGISGSIALKLRPLPFPFDLQMSYMRLLFESFIEAQSPELIFDAKITVSNSTMNLQIDIPINDKHLPEIFTTVLERQNMDSRYVVTGFSFGKDARNAVQTFSGIRISAFILQQLATKFNLLSMIPVCSPLI